MAHPSDFFQGGFSEGNGIFISSGDSKSHEECGWSCCQWFKRCIKLEKFANLRYFCILLGCVGAFQGMIINYYRLTSHIWGNHFNISHKSVGWLIYTNEVFVGILALCVAYWGNRIHRAAWTGGLTMFLAASGLTLAIPEIYKPYTTNEIDPDMAGTDLCGNYSKFTHASSEFDAIYFMSMQVFNMMFAVAFVSFICYGISFIDDNASKTDSPVYIAAVMATFEGGKYFGSYLSWTPYIMGLNTIFVSPVWILVTLMTLVVGFLITLFPKSLLLKTRSNSDTYSGNEATEVIDTEGITTTNQCCPQFITTMKRLLKNKILMLNIAAYICVETALINFHIMERTFNQAKYNMAVDYSTSGLSDPRVIHFTKYLLQQPIVIAFMILSGIFISKFKPSTKIVLLWNIFALLAVVLVVCPTEFFTCRTYTNYQLIRQPSPYCSSDCGCPINESFQPVCVEGEITHFSPCIAGCRTYNITSQEYNCSCGSHVTKGSCELINCKTMISLTQVHIAVMYGLAGATVVPSTIISIRSVDITDNAMASGLTLCIKGLIPYIPFRYIYYLISNTFCNIWSETNECIYYSSNVANFLSAATVFLMISGAVLNIVLIFIVKDMSLFKIKQPILEKQQTTGSHKDMPFLGNMPLCRLPLEFKGPIEDPSYVMDPRMNTTLTTFLGTPDSGSCPSSDTEETSSDRTESDLKLNETQDVPVEYEEQSQLSDTFELSEEEAKDIYLQRVTLHNYCRELEAIQEESTNKAEKKSTTTNLLSDSYNYGAEIFIMYQDLEETRL